MSKKNKKTRQEFRTKFLPLKEYTTPAGNHILDVGEAWLEWWPERDGNRQGACFSAYLPELIKILVKYFNESQQ